MGSVLREYPYLVGTLAGLAVYVAALIAFRAHRRLMLAGSILALPQAFFALVLVPEYWNPKRVAVILVGPEDLLFSFGVGGLAWLLTAGLAGARLITDVRPARLVLRFLALHVFGAFLLGLLLVADLQRIHAIFSAMTITALLLIWLRPEFWKLGAAGALLAMGAYAVLLKLSLVLWPDLAHAWTGPNLWGIYVWGMPLEEIVWACLYCPVWGGCLAYMFDAKRGTTTAPDAVRRASHEVTPGSGGAR